MKIAICAICKNENIYLREWVEHHKRLGFDKIFLYDNNPVDGEYPHQVIGNYITEGFVDVKNIRGYHFNSNDQQFSLQLNVYKQCRIEQQFDYKWMAFIDVDEFITITPDEPQNIHELFDKYRYDYNGFEQIILSWKSMSNSGELFYNSKPVLERFMEPAEISENKKIGINNFWVKSIIRTDIPEELPSNQHAIPGLYSCSSYGLWIPCGEEGALFALTNPIHGVMYVSHYWSKSFMEYLPKRINDVHFSQRLYDWKDINGWGREHQRLLNEFKEYVNNREIIQGFET